MHTRNFVLFILSMKVWAFASLARFARHASLEPVFIIGNRLNLKDL
jgi:hypothetical protein